LTERAAIELDGDDTPRMRAECGDTLVEQLLVVEVELLEVVRIDGHALAPDDALG
jgi:hypothetical protein